MSQTPATQLRFLSGLIAAACLASCATVLNAQRTQRMPTLRLGTRSRCFVSEIGKIQHIEWSASGQPELTVKRYELAFGLRAPRRGSWSWDLPAWILRWKSAQMQLRMAALATVCGDTPLFVLEVDAGRGQRFDLAKTRSIQLADGSCILLRDPIQNEQACVAVLGQGVELEQNSFVVRAEHARFLITIAPDAATALGRLATARYAAAQWIPRLRTSLLLWQAKLPRILQTSDPLYAGFMAALLQLRAQLLTLPGGLVPLDSKLQSSERAPLGTAVFLAQAAQLSGLRTWVQPLRRAARVGRDALEREQLCSLERLLGMPALLATKSQRLAGLPRLVCAWSSGRAEAVLSFDAWLVQQLASAKPARERVLDLLLAKRIPMLLEPRDERACASLLLLGTAQRPLSLLGLAGERAVQKSIAQSQARVLCELLRADGTLGWRGRLRPGARPLAERRTSPLATSWLAELRLEAGDLGGARRALEACERRRAQRPSRLFAWLYGEAGRADLRPQSARAAAAFVRSVLRLRAAETRAATQAARLTGVTVRPLPQLLPRVLPRYANQDAAYLRAYARCEAFCLQLAPRLGKGVRGHVETRALARKLAGPSLQAEIGRLQALASDIERAFEQALMR